MTLRLRSSEEAFRDALLVRLRDTRPLVQDINADYVIPRQDAAPDFAAFGRVLDGILQEVADRKTNKDPVTSYDVGRRSLVSKFYRDVDLICCELHLQLRGHFRDKDGDIDLLVVRDALRRIDGGKIDKLPHHPAGSVDAGGDAGEGLALDGWIVGSKSNLRLGLETCKGCLQFMRGIGGEAPFAVSCFGHTPEQAVQRPDDRPHFPRNGSGIHRMKFGCGTAGKAFSDAGQWGETATDAQPDQPRKDREDNDARNEKSLDDVAYQPISDFKAVTDQHADPKRWIDDGIDPPPFSVDLRFFEAIRMAGERGCGCAFRTADEAALKRPDLAGKLAAVAAAGFFEWRRGSIRGSGIGCGSGVNLMIRDQRTYHACRFHQPRVQHALDFRLRAGIDPGGSEEPHRAGRGNEDRKQPDPY